MELFNEQQLTLVTSASRNGGWEGYWGHWRAAALNPRAVTVVVVVLAVTPVVAAMVVHGNW
ncbi:hypothetical protein [Mixta hanseatica]|uniref:Uncharacterized protein n=1 Tax=Mixta hanseatica TaxID=2872648 RepID=A0ABY4R6R7_9GAMM|nr:hypothetical protein [Mixta hanseatica]UQY42953.1 hypothetical protein K6958_13665 [Mixta hanseatica]